ncbi:MAG TPA: hypothetical protein VGH88_23065 [Streptosporangiaceae bacterium]
MIKIRYADLPAGLHVRAERSGRSTVIYLLPGLTHTERRAALLRARRSSGLGHGPQLPAGSVAAAVARDRIAATARKGAAAFRAHPLLLLPPVLIAASATLAYVMMSAVSITFPQSAPGGPARPGPSATSGGTPSASGSPGVPGAGPARPGGSRDPRAPGAGPGPSRSASPSPRPPGPGRSSPPGSPAPAPSSPPPPTDPAPSSGPVSPTPAPAPTPTPTPSPTPSSCLNLGVLGVCLK